MGCAGKEVEGELVESCEVAGDCATIRDGNGAGLGRGHLDPDPFIFHRPRPAPDPLVLDFSDLDPDPLGLASPWVLTGS